MPESGFLRWPRRSATLNYAVALLSVTVALVANAAIVQFVMSSPTALLLECAVMFSAWFGGLGPGLFATALSMPSFGYFFVPPECTAHVLGIDATRMLFLGATALFAVWLNVTRRTTQENLLRSQAYLDEAQRLSHTGSFGWRPASGKTVWSKATYRILEYDDDAEPTIDGVLERVHPDDQEFVRREMDSTARAGKDYDYEHRIVTPDGSIKYLHVRARRVQYDSGEQEIVGALMDVTAARKAQESLQMAQAELARVTRITALGEMSASIAHEVNQPLGAIATNAAASENWLAREEPQVSEARAAVRRIVEDANRASAVIRRIREVAAKANPAMIAVDINKVVTETISLVKREALVHHVSLELHLAPELPLVRGDPIQLQQVLINLAMNGFQAMDTVTDRPRVLTVRTEKSAPHEVQLRVHDTGVGAPAQALEQLFDAFYTTKRDGMGMGLAICRSIIVAHGGQVCAVRNAGPGMTFCVTIPTLAAQ
jgi:signal transduction histidine kinase